MSGLGRILFRAATAFLQQKGQQAHPAFPGVSHTTKAPTESEEEREASKLEATVAGVFGDLEAEDKKKGATVQTAGDGEKAERRDRDGRRGRGTDAKDKRDDKRKHEHKKRRSQLQARSCPKGDREEGPGVAPEDTREGRRQTPSTLRKSTKLIWDSDEEGIDLADSAIANASQRLKTGAKRKLENSTPGSNKKRATGWGTAPPTPSQTTPAMDEHEGKKPATRHH